MKNYNVPLNKIEFKADLQARERMSSETIAEYKADMLDGDKFPPVTLYDDGKTLWLADGYHRVAAALQLELTHINADVHPGTRRDAMFAAINANAKHGLRRTRDDKRRAVRLLLLDDEWRTWSDRQIARHASVDHKTVGSIRAELVAAGEIPQLDQRKTASGGTMNTATINADRRPTEPEQKTTLQDVEFVDGEIQPGDVVLTPKGNIGTVKAIEGDSALVSNGHYSERHRLKTLKLAEVIDEADTFAPATLDPGAYPDLPWYHRYRKLKLDHALGKILLIELDDYLYIALGAEADIIKGYYEQYARNNHRFWGWHPNTAVGKVLVIKDQPGLKILESVGETLVIYQEQLDIIGLREFCNRLSTPAQVELVDQPVAQPAAPLRTCANCGNQYEYVEADREYTIDYCDTCYAAHHQQNSDEIAAFNASTPDGVTPDDTTAEPELNLNNVIEDVLDYFYMNKHIPEDQIREYLDFAIEKLTDLKNELDHIGATA